VIATFLCAWLGWFCPVQVDTPAHVGTPTPAPADYSKITADCLRYRTLIQEQDQPSRLAAQMEVESSCNPVARSSVAHGLYQFVPATAKWLSRGACRLLGPARPYSPEWSIKCAAIYMGMLEKQTAYANSECEIRTLAERCYNGGCRWVERERDRVIATRGDSGSAEEIGLQCGNTGRSKANCNENLSYPKKISDRQPKYRDYGGGICLDVVDS